MFVVMLTLTLMLIHTIFASRNRVAANYTDRENRRFKKDLKLSITSVILNVIYILFYAPSVVYIYFFPRSHDIFYYLTIYVFFISTSNNFYVLYLTNLFFRKRFISFFVQTNKAEHRSRVSMANGDHQQTSYL